MKPARFRAWLIALLPLLLLAGCSSLFESAKPKTRDPNKLVEFKQSARLDVRWHQDAGSAGDSVLQPAVTRDAIYAANAREVIRLDRVTGKQAWRVESGFAITGGVGAGEGLVLVGGAKGDVAAFGEDGKLRWKAKVSSEVLSAPQAANNMVVVRTGDGRIAGLSVADGKRQWLYERATPALTVRSHAAGVTIKRGIVYAGFAGGRMALLNVSSGALLWEVSVSQPRGNTELERISDITSLPVVDDEEVCAVAFQGSVACFELAQGNPIWSREISSDKGLALSRKYVFVTSANGEVSALDKNSGSSLWKSDDLTLRRTSAPLLVGDYVAVGDYEGYLHLLKGEDGGMAARFRADGGTIATAPQELDGGLLVQTAGGNLYSLAIH